MQFSKLFLKGKVLKHHSIEEKITESLHICFKSRSFHLQTHKTGWHGHPGSLSPTRPATWATRVSVRCWVVESHLPRQGTVTIRNESHRPEWPGTRAWVWLFNICYLLQAPQWSYEHGVTISVLKQRSENPGGLMFQLSLCPITLSLTLLHFIAKQERWRDPYSYFSHKPMPLGYILAKNGMIFWLIER